MSDTDRILKEHDISHKNEAKILTALAEIAAALSPERRLDRIETLLKTIIKKETQIMAFQQDALDAIAGETTLIGSVKMLVQQVLEGLGDQVTPEAKAAILAALGGNRAQLQEVETALRSNVTPTP